MRKTSFLKKIIFIVIAIGTITSGIFVVRAVNNRGNAPVAWWKMDEGQGQTTYDASGNGNNGTLGASTSDTTPDPTWKNEESCKNGKCLQFDGADDYVSGNTTRFSYTTGTIEMWVYPTSVADKYLFIFGSYGTNMVAIDSDESGANNFSLHLRNGTSNLVTGYVPFTLNSWQHVVGVYTATTVQLYINGVLMASSVGTNPNTALGTTYYIGRYSTSGYYFGGTIDDVRVYNYARTASQIKADYNKSAGGKGASVKVGSSQESQNASEGLVAYWKMDEASWVADSAVVLDSSGNGYNGTPKNHATSTATAKFGRAGTFDGTDDYVNISPVISSVASATAGTMSFWFKPTLLKDYEDLIGFSAYIGGQNRQIRVTANAAGTLFGITYDDAQKWTIESNSPVFTVGTWTFVTLVQDGTAPVFYVNGKLIPITFTQSVDKTFWFADTTFDTALIGSLSYADYTQGQIDDVKIYKVARSAEQIQRDYETGPPPIMHLRMDENTGQYANDTSGTNNGTLGTDANANASDPQWTNGKYGSALKFDGTDDYVNTTFNPQTALAQNFTISAWVNPSATGNYRGVAGAHTAAFQGVAFLQWNTDGWDVSYGDGSAWPTGVSTLLTLNTWTHVVATFEGSVQIKLYVNGVLTQTQPQATAVSHTNSFWIGRAYNASGRYFNGQIDDVRIYNYARTQKQIMEDMNAGHPASAEASAGNAGSGRPGSYAGYWNFDEGQGDTAYDKSANANNGDLAGSCPGAATCPTWTTAGKFGKALSFDGGDYVNLVDTSAFKLQQFSISAWFKVSSYSVSRPIFGNYNYNMYYGYVLEVGTDGKIYFVTNTSVGGILDQVTSNTIVTVGSWYHVTVTLDGSAIKMYVNGVYDNQDSSQQTLVYDTLHYPSIGRNTYRTEGGYQRFFSGLIDDVKIYPFALSPAEIKEEFNRGSSLKLGALGTESDGTTPSNSALSAYCVPGDTTSCAAPVAHWKMDEKIDNTCSGGVNDVCDTSGNGNDGANTGGPVWKSAASCKSGSCLSFDGVNDYVVTTDVSVAGSAFTLSAWVFVSSYPSSYSRILCKAESGVDYPEYCLSVKNTGVIWLETTESAVGSNYSSMDTTNTITNNRWYHIVATNDKTTLRVYINGVADPTTGTGRTPYNNDDAMYIGAEKLNVSPYYTRLFNGLIDDVRIYNYARTPAQIAWDYNRGGPVASWSMDSVGVSASPGTALNVYDSSGKANTGVSSGETMNNGTITGATWKDGSNCKYGSCLSFDGNDYVSVPDSSVQDTGGAITVSAWIKTSTACSGDAIATHDLSNYKWLLYCSSTPNATPDFYVRTASGVSNVAAAINLKDGLWHHIVGTFDKTLASNRLKLYVDGTLNKEVNGYAEDITAGDEGIYIGSHFDSLVTAGYPGSIDDVRIYNTALTADQVAALYNNNDRAAGASLEGNLIGEWRFDEGGGSYAVDTHYQRVGKYGYAMNFDGSNDYVDVGSGSSLHPTKYITISVWVKPGSTQLIYADIMGNHAVGSGLNGYTIQQSGSNLNKFGFSYGNGSTWQGGTVLTQLVANQWNHYVVQKDDTVMRSYLNGVLVGQENVSGDIVYGTTHPIYIGVGWTNLTRYFNGLIDDVRIYNYVRSADQIKQDYNQGAAVRFGPLEGLP